MPWAAIPYAAAALRERLNSVFDVNGIPTLILLDGEGNIITTDGRARIAQDPQVRLCHSVILTYRVLYRTDVHELHRTRRYVM